MQASPKPFQPVFVLSQVHQLPTDIERPDTAPKLCHLPTAQAVPVPRPIARTEQTNPANLSARNVYPNIKYLAWLLYIVCQVAYTHASRFRSSGFSSSSFSGLYGTRQELAGPEQYPSACSPRVEP